MDRGEIADAYVRALRDDAAAAGDVGLVAVCDLALYGASRAVLSAEVAALAVESARAEAWERCVDLIREATLR